jgi:hypothetical protein
MSTGHAEQAHSVVAVFSTGEGPGAWRLDRRVVADRLHELVDNPSAVRQGKLNLCGPAAVFTMWLRHDPVAAVTYAVRLYEDGRAPIGTRMVTPSRKLLGVRYAQTARALGCPQADWMMMAALRDSSHRVLRYVRQGGVGEAVAAVTPPATLRSWLGATGLYSRIGDETSLVLRKGIGHAYGLRPSTGRELFLLVALEMFRRPISRASRARDFVVSHLPNHWVVLRTPVTPAGRSHVAFEFWSWGAEHSVMLERSVFSRCYYGCLVAESPLRVAAPSA